ncbi:hypothetical protein CW751_12355 [Brumimicrobium salinarum]|uniref:Uncharacterized protein n=1 Tax=Brumimicrobium salinarum TaxID=2058658 RepID=A0A2I0R0B6_9FLAO|nr:hypothetical protein [Brumimicrobium salinarum]PKR80009.1 hypothetical protein CW751_12355 [Brumimicrobium salinarum]
MSKIESYKDLLLEEERIEKEIALRRLSLETNIKSYLSPANLYGYFEEELGKNFGHEFTGKFDLQKYLINLSLDFLYEKVSYQLLKGSVEKSNGLDWRIIARSFVDRLYSNNKPYLTEIISAYVDKYIEKWTNK